MSIFLCFQIHCLRDRFPAARQLRDLVALDEHIILLAEVVELHGNAAGVVLVDDPAAGNHACLDVQAGLAFNVPEAAVWDRNVNAGVEGVVVSRPEDKRLAASQVKTCVGRVCAFRHICSVIKFDFHAVIILLSVPGATISDIREAGK